jgi:hypothetical protein
MEAGASKPEIRVGLTLPKTVLADLPTRIHYGYLK